MIDRLFVIWSAPADGRRHIIGHLTRGQGPTGQFRFWYEPDLTNAMAHGFGFLPAFPDHRPETAPYEARYLFTTFADRIPSPSRLDAPSMLASWGVQDPDDQFEILARSGGIRATDSIELAEYRALDDTIEQPLEFRIAGGKHIPVSERATLIPGEHLTLRREPDNVADAAATLVVARTGYQAGYVPRQYSGLIARLLDAGVALSAMAMRELLVPEDAGRWVVRTRRDG